jgi:hypothetical protein
MAQRSVSMHSDAKAIQRAHRSVVLLLLIWFAGGRATAGQEAADWFDEPPQPGVPQVAEGELRFLTSAPASRILESLNRLSVSAHSLEDGWVGLHQCYRGLDPVPDAEIVYAYRNMRGLEIQSHKGIARATARQTSIVLEGVGRDAQLCVVAEVQILRRNADGHYRLRNGPFHRRFLDGYFPMRVTLDVLLPAARLRLLSVSPPAQPGFSVAQDPGRLSIDALFAGSLTIEAVFAAVVPASAPD